MAEITGGYTGSFAPAVPSYTADFNVHHNSQSTDSSTEQLSELDNSKTEQDNDIRNDWKYITDVQKIQEQNRNGGIKGRKLGLTWKNLCIQGAGADIVYVRIVCKSIRRIVVDVYRTKTSSRNSIRETKPMATVKRSRTSSPILLDVSNQERCSLSSVDLALAVPLS